ncbi:MAG: oxidoreductase, partial [Bradyrhizobium sp.]|nr:oxidoreductase [Bradyrhizobium sp.]
MSPIEVAVVGDRFMRPQAFVDALSRLEGAEFAFRTMELPWPDEPMEHGYAKAGLAGLKEYQGDPDAIEDFVG